MVAMGILAVGFCLGAGVTQAKWQNAWQERNAYDTAFYNDFIWPRLVRAAELQEENTELKSEVAILRVKLEDALTRPPEIITKIEYVRLTWEGSPFQSRLELSGYLLTLPLDLPIHVWGKLDLTSAPDCEDYAAFSLAYKMIQDGYLVGFDLIENRAHLWVIVPVPAENRFYFVESETRKISDTLNGREWRLD